MSRAKKAGMWMILAVLLAMPVMAITINGRITDATGDGICGAEVVIRCGVGDANPDTKYTDADGYYTHTFSCDFNIWYTASKASYATKIVVNIPNIQLNTEPIAAVNGRLQGYVYDSTTSTPLVGQYLTISGSPAITDSCGFYAVDLSVGCLASLRTSYPGYCNYYKGPLNPPNCGPILILSGQVTTENAYIYPGSGDCVPCTDSDGDGYGLEGTDLSQCTASTTFWDCDDASPAIHPGAAEVCDGVDDNCDAYVDNSPGTAADNTLTQSCYTGPAGTENVGICHGGTQTCSAGAWGSCTGEVLPAAEVCGDSIDQDCDDEDLQCICTLTNAYWSHESTTAGTKVTMTIEGTNCDGLDVLFDIWEDDTLSGDDGVSEYSGTPTAAFVSGMAEGAWYALYMPDCVVFGYPTCDPPEYYFNAIVTLPDSPTRSPRRSQGPGAKGLMEVRPNQLPALPEPFLIKPNGGEIYNQSANITWNPAIDPEDDAVVYSLYYSDDSGNAWSLIADNYGFISQIEGQNTFVLDFSSPASNTRQIAVPKIAHVYMATFDVSGDFAENPKIDVGDDGIYEWEITNPEGFTGKETIDDFSDVLNSYIEANCDIPAGQDCQIPITFSADSGVIAISNIIIQYTNYWWDTSLMPNGIHYRVMLIAEEIPVCGNWKLEGDEQCDDGNNIDGDGCSAACIIEVAPLPACGDGNVDAGEECDDGNTENGDGCSAVCTIEAGPVAGIECAYTTTQCASPYIEALRASSISDAHSSLPGQGGFTSYICCKAGVTLDTTCSQAKFLQLSDAQDAHVQKNGAGGFTNNACLSAAGGTVSCGYAADCAVAGYSACLASISDTTDAHIGNCNAYSTKVCCKLT